MDTEKFKVVVEVKKFIEFSDSLLVNYPRSSRVLKDRIENYSYDLLEFVYYANLLKNRVEYQKRIIVMISMLDYFLELS